MFNATTRIQSLVPAPRQGSLWQFPGVPAQLIFMPNIPAAIGHVCHAVCQRFKGFCEGAPTVVTSVINADVIAARAVTRVNFIHKTNLININLSDNLDLSQPANQGYMTYIMLHELFVHAAPNSWELAFRQGVTHITDEENQTISDVHHTSMFSSGEQSFFHTVVKAGLQYFPSGEPRQQYLNAYVRDLDIYIGRLTQSGVLQGTQKRDADLWLARLKTEAQSMYSRFWLG